jgi:formylglycine-generating enzyme required for sulfatase activity
VAVTTSFTAKLPARAADTSGKRFALVIANSVYPDAPSPIASAEKDAAVFADELRLDGFQVDVKQDAGKLDMQTAIDAFTNKITPGSVAVLYYNGFGIQVARQTYMVPVNAQIWSEIEATRDGISVDATLNEMKRRGASVKIVILDASRRNPFERRFRPVSEGLASLNAPEGTLAMFSAAPGKVTEDRSDGVSLFMSELLKELRTPDISAEEALTHTRIGVSTASNGAQVPWVASSLVDDFSFTGTAPPQSLIVTDTPKPRQRAGSTDSTRSTQTSTAASSSPASQPVQKTAATPSGSDASATPAKQADPPSDAAKTAAAKTTASSTSVSSTSTSSNAGGSTPAKSATTDSAPTATDANPPAATGDKPGSSEQAMLVKPNNPAEMKSTAVELKPRDIFRDCPNCPDLVVLEGGAFLMGTPTSPNEHLSRMDALVLSFERPTHRVTIARPFAMGRAPITFAEWDLCVSAGGCRSHPKDQGWGRGSRPVINVSWTDANEYVTWLSQKTGHAYRLPSEAEWEYAARGGASTPFSWGQTVGVDMANCQDCGNGLGKQTVAVKAFPPNAFGLYDMGGNVAQWVQDCWNSNYRGAPKDGSAWLTGDCSNHVLRGGSFGSTSIAIKPSARFRYNDVAYYANGFRVARDIP